MLLFGLSILGIIVVLSVLGLPLAFSFLFANIVGLLYLGGWQNLLTVIDLGFSSVVNFTLLPIPLFILLGELLVACGLIHRLIDTVNKNTMNIPGRLPLIVLTSNAIFGAISGSTLSAAAIFGKAFSKRFMEDGYDNKLWTGLICASSTLAMLIPPSGMAVILAVIAGLPINKILIGAAVPGVLMVLCFAVYIMIIAYTRPDLVPRSKKELFTFKEKMSSLLAVLPLLFVVLLTTGLILFGIATPSESAAIGSIGALLLFFIYNRTDTFQKLNTMLFEMAKVSAMILFILFGATVFSNMLALSGVTQAITGIVTTLEVSPLFIVMIMMMILLIMGCFLDPVSIMMIALPVYFPIIKAVGLDPVWFGLLILVNMAIAQVTPPFGFMLFTLKAVVPATIKIGTIYRGVFSYVLIMLFVLFLGVAFPSIYTWLPGLVK